MKVFDLSNLTTSEWQIFSAVFYSGIFSQETRVIRPQSTDPEQLQQVLTSLENYVINHSKGRK